MGTALKEASRRWSCWAPPSSLGVCFGHRPGLSPSLRFRITPSPVFSPWMLQASWLRHPVERTSVYPSRDRSALKKPTDSHHRRPTNVWKDECQVAALGGGRMAGREHNAI